MGVLVVPDDTVPADAVVLDRALRDTSVDDLCRTLGLGADDCVSLDPGTRTVRCNGDVKALTYKETAVLELLLTARGAVVSAETLLRQVWSDRPDPDPSVVRVTMMQLRRKLGPPDVIHTVVRAGYRG